MKKFKLIDFWISSLLIIAFTVFTLVRLDHTFIIGYFVVGGWQIISMLVHINTGCFTIKGGERYNYHRVIIILLITILLGFIIPYFFLVLFLLVFIAPVMAIYYTWICYDEVYHKMQRPLALLK